MERVVFTQCESVVHAHVGNVVSPGVNESADFNGVVGMLHRAFGHALVLQLVPHLLLGVPHHLAEPSAGLDGPIVALVELLNAV